MLIRTIDAKEEEQYGAFLLDVSAGVFILVQTTYGKASAVEVCASRSTLVCSKPVDDVRGQHAFSSSTFAVNPERIQTVGARYPALEIRMNENPHARFGRVSTMGEFRTELVKLAGGRLQRNLDGLACLGCTCRPVITRSECFGDTLGRALDSIFHICQYHVVIWIIANFELVQLLVCKVKASTYGVGYACGGFADHYVWVQRNALHLIVTVQQGLGKLVASVQPFEVSLHVVKVQ